MLRNLIIAEGNVATKDGQPFGFGVPVGLGLAHLPIIYRGEQWGQRPATRAEVNLPPRFDVGSPPNIEVWVNKRLAFQADDSFQMYSQAFGGQTFRISLRVRIDKPTHDIRIVVYGQDMRLTVENQAERQPCKVEIVPRVGWLITLADGKTPGTDDLESLGWMLGGVIDTALPAGSAEQYASEVDAAQQYRQRPTIWRSIDFVVQPDASSETYGPPLVLERERWAPLFGGDIETKREIEGQLNIQYFGWVYSRKGWATFGDWPHEPGVKQRCRYADHYLSVTALHRAVVRSSNPIIWNRMTLASSAHVRDLCWSKGWKSHAKGLTPWSGPWGVAEHWVDSESLLMAWLVYGDDFARREYMHWLAAWREPQGPGRESCVAKRMCDVAHAYTGEAKWRERSDKLQASLLADIESGKPLTGPLWHPEWCDKVILKDQPRPEGIINGRAFPIAHNWQQQDRNAKLELIPNGPGPLGEGHLLLQMHRMRTGPQVYGANVGDPRDPARYSTRITVDKRDAKPLDLCLRVGRRIRGDLHAIGLRVYDPAGTLVLDNQAIKLGPMEFDAWGFGCWKYQTSVAGPAGKWTVDVTSYALALYAPVSDWREKQEGAEFKFPAY